jgi:hypothetical protein
VTWLRADDGVNTGGSAQFYDRTFLVAGSLVNPLTSDFCPSGWLYLDSLAANNSIFCTGATSDGEDGTHIWVDTNGAVQLAFNDSVQGSRLTGALSANGAVVVSTWYHWAVNFDRDGNATLYLNGVAKLSVAISTHAASLGATRTRFGNDGGTTYFNGRMSDVYYWTRVLTTAEITWLYQLGNPRSYNEFGTAGDGAALLTGLPAGWPMHEVSGTRADVVGTNTLTPTYANLLSNPGYETLSGQTGKSYLNSDKSGYKYTGAGADIGTNDFTIVATVKPTATPSGDVFTIASAGTAGAGNDYYWLYLNASRVPVLEFNDSSGAAVTTTFNTALAENTRYTLIVTGDRDGNVACYVNNAAEATTGDISGKALSHTAGNLAVGTYAGGPNNGFTGIIAKVGVWSRILTSGERSEYHASGLGLYYGQLAAGTQSGCLVFYDSTDPTGTTLTDQASTNDGTLVAAEIFGNAGFETAGGGGGDVFADWGEFKADGVIADELVIVHGGGHAASLTRVASTCYLQQAGMTLTREYTLSAWARADSGTPTMGYGQAGAASSVVISTSYTQYQMTLTASSSANVVFTNYTDGSTIYIDDASLTAASIPTVSDADLFGSWTETAGGGSIDCETTNPDAGAVSLRMKADGAASLLRETILTAGRSYTWIMRAKALTNGDGLYDPVNTAFTVPFTTSWATYTATRTAADAFFTVYRYNTPATTYVDGLSCVGTTMPGANGPSEAMASDSVGSNHGTLVGRTAATLITDWSTDVPSVDVCEGGYSLNFDGTDDFVTVADAAALRFDAGTLDFTIAAWVKTSQKTRAIIEKRDANDDGWWLGINGSGYIAFSLDTLDAAGAADVTDGAWHHVGVTVDRDGDILIFTDGVWTGGAVGVSSEAMATTAAVLIGKDSVASTFFSGKIDDIRIYSSKLSAAQMAALAAGDDTAANWPGAPTVAHWKFDDGPQTIDPVNGEPIIAWESQGTDRSQFFATTLGYRPDHDAATFGGRESESFDGIDDYIAYPASLTTDSGDGTLIIIFRTAATAFAADQTLLASADEGTANNYLQVGIDSAGKCFIESNVAGTVNRVTGNTVLANSTRYCLVITSSGTAWAMWVNRTAQTLTVTGANSGNWFGDISGRDNVTLGALLTSAGVTEAFEGLIADVGLASDQKSAAQSRALQNYAIGYYGITP